MENNKICRLCTQKGDNYKDILHRRQAEAFKIITQFLNIQIRVEDPYHFMCSRCNERLTEFKKFYNETQEAQTYFESLLKTEEPFINFFTKELEIKIETEDDEFPGHVKKETKENVDDNFQGDTFEVLNDDQSMSQSPAIKSDDSEQMSGNEDPIEGGREKISARTLKLVDRDKAINGFFNFKCPKCSLKASNWSEYRKHLIQKHSDTNAPVIKCCDREIQLERRPLLAHVQYHTNPEKLQCKWCTKQFVNVDSKRKHEWRHKANRDGTNVKTESQKVPCSVCGKVLADKFSFKKHIQVHLSAEEREKLKVQCDFCQKFFKGKSSLIIHMKDAHMPKQESVSCDQCAKVFPNSRVFHIHYKTHHTGDNRVICPDCGVDMKAVSLRRHRRLKHDTLSQTCPICFKEFKNRTSLMLHQGRVHIEPKFSCDICGRMFKQKDKYKEHREAHFTSNRFSCDQCEYINNDYANMLKHRKTKHPDAPLLAPGTGRKVFEAR